MGSERITAIERDPARLDEALPWYLNGTLSEADRAWVEETLAAQSFAGSGADPYGQTAFDRGVQAAFERKLAEVPEDIGWSRLLQRARAETAGAPGMTRPAAAVSPGKSWFQRMAARWSPMLSPQLGMALVALVAVQTVAIGVLVGERSGTGQPDTVSYRTGDAAIPVPAIRALLNETISEKQLREALSANGARIVDGPNPLGEYWIVTGDRDPAAVAGSLRDAGVIASFVIDQRLQGR